MAFPPDPDSFSSYLNYKFISAPQTAWQGIFQLVPGECIEYWESKPMHFRLPQNRESCCKTLSSAMDEAFSAVIPADRPFGIALSGGIDSGLLLAWCLKRGRKPELFSIRFPEGSSTYGDTKALEEMALRYGFTVHWSDFNAEEFRKITSCQNPWDILVADSALILTQKIAHEARSRGIHILLSGAGADEYFGGYRRHAFFQRWNSTLEMIPDWIFEWVGSLLRPGKMAWMNIDGGGVEALWQMAVSSRMNSSLYELQLLPLPHSEKSLPENMLAWDQQYYLPFDVLSISDLAGMAEGVEMRFPFLHPAMTSFANSLLLEQRMGSGRKEILRDEFRKCFGNHLADRKKQGFGIPDAGLFSTEKEQKELSRWLDYLDQEASQIFNQKNWEKFRKEAMIAPEKFLQEWIAIGRLCSWLKLHQKPADGAPLP